jgi:TonB family protein
VALPGPGIAFAVPVEGPVRIVAAQAAVVAPRVPAAAHSAAASGIGPPGAGHRATAVAPAPPPVARLTLGQGEGDQPRPEYPREAILGRQEGIVQVHLGVGADGQVLWAQAGERCPWPLLNQSALRTVREAWHFTAGLPRVYDVAIEFQLHRSDAGEP